MVKNGIVRNANMNLFIEMDGVFSVNDKSIPLNDSQ